jgi:hypothetical protein
MGNQVTCHLLVSLAWNVALVTCHLLVSLAWNVDLERTMVMSKAGRLVEPGNCRFARPA